MRAVEESVDELVNHTGFFNAVVLISVVLHWHVEKTVSGELTLPDKRLLIEPRAAKGRLKNNFGVSVG